MKKMTPLMLSNSRIIELSNHHYMRLALSLARRNLGQTWPNPAVGAVIVKDGKIIAEGWTARGGRPHAETQALEDAGAMANDATLYVTLEPCAHHGKTPPCAEAVIKAGIRRCVIACRDPNPLVNGKGIEQLREAGIEVIEGICEKEAIELNCGFFSVVKKKRPYIALKIATSADDKISFPSPTGRRWREAPDEGGEAYSMPNVLHRPHPNPLPKGEGIRWITGEQARAYGHLLRSQYDAIATGIGTVLADDPLLTCRLPGLEDRSPVRVLFDRQGRLPEDSHLEKTAKDAPVWVIDQSLPDALKTLTERGITRLLVEAGQRLSTAFLQSGLVDRIYWFRAPIVIGDGGLEAFSGGFSPDLAHWRQKALLSLCEDTLTIYDRIE